MPADAVVDASPLIHLSKGGHFDLLRLLGGRVLIPSLVLTEIERRGLTDPTVVALAAADWVVAVDDPDVPAVIQAWDLGFGESSVLAYAWSHPGTIAIIDDLQGRRCAEALGVSIHGTLGLVLLAKRHGLIAAARPVLEELRDQGMYLADRTLDRALGLVGE